MHPDQDPTITRARLLRMLLLRAALHMLRQKDTQGWVSRMHHLAGMVMASPMLLDMEDRRVNLEFHRLAEGIGTSASPASMGSHVVDRTVIDGNGDKMSREGNGMTVNMYPERKSVFSFITRLSVMYKTCP